MRLTLGSFNRTRGFQENYFQASYEVYIKKTVGHWLEPQGFNMGHAIYTFWSKKNLKNIVPTQNGGYKHKSTQACTGQPVVIFVIKLKISCIRFLFKT